MNEKKLDLRVVKTRHAIKNAFLNLLQEKDFDKITVQDIASTAMINRNTFYLHYMDKYDLMDYLCRENIEKINKALDFNSNTIYMPDINSLNVSLNNLFKTLEENIVFFKGALKNNQLSFMENLKETLRILFTNSNENKTKNTEDDINLEYKLSGLVGVISLWINNHKEIPVSVIVDQLTDIYLNMFLDK